MPACTTASKQRPATLSVCASSEPCSVAIPNSAVKWKPVSLEVKGWRLLQYPLFGNQLKKLTETVEQLKITQPDTYKQHPKTKLLATIHRYVTESIPRNPND